MFLDEDDTLHTPKKPLYLPHKQITIGFSTSISQSQSTLRIFAVTAGCASRKFEWDLYLSSNVFAIILDHNAWERYQGAGADNGSMTIRSACASSVIHVDRECLVITISKSTIDQSFGKGHRASPTGLRLFAMIFFITNICISILLLQLENQRFRYSAECEVSFGEEFRVGTYK